MSSPDTGWPGRLVPRRASRDDVPSRRPEPVVPRRARRDERGSGTVQVMVHLSVVTVVGMALAVVAAMFVAHREAQSAADLSALAGARRLVDGDGAAAACSAASGIARANGARLVDCATGDREVRVQVSVASPSWSVLRQRLPDLTARARAGPVGNAVS